MSDDTSLSPVSLPFYLTRRPARGHADGRVGTPTGAHWGVGTLMGTHRRVGTPTGARWHVGSLCEGAP